MSSTPGPYGRDDRHVSSVLEELTLERPDFTAQTVQILKFHGMYQQTDRDLRKTGRPREYGCMVRVAVPGGVLTPDQYLELDRLADEVGDGRLRITTRQDVEFHGVRKPDLRSTVRALNASLLTTLAAGGDTVRNVVCCPAPFPSHVRSGVQALAAGLAATFRPESRSYYEIWLDGEPAVSAEARNNEAALYGPGYLPRKFKIGIAAPGDNCIDVYSNDVGVVPGPGGFTLLVGGGLGVSPGVKATHPRLAEPLGFVVPEQLEPALKAILGIHRDCSNRANRMLARLKYVLEDWGMERFRAEFETRFGAPIAPPAPLHWHSASDHLGWHEQHSGSHFLGVPIPSGRIRGEVRATLREVVRSLRTEVRLTTQQNLLLTNIASDERAEVARILVSSGVRLADDVPPAVRGALACVALPSCGRAITEAERVVPEIAAAIHGEMAALGIGGESISIRVTGCPNGCAHPYTAEIGIVGRSADLYSIYLGASALGTRLGSVFAENVRRSDIQLSLRPVLQAYVRHRAPGETFGDFCARAGVEALRAGEADTN